MPLVAEVVMFFNISAFGPALAWLLTVWATALLAGRRIWDAALVAASPLLIFQIFTNFDAPAVACATGALLAWARAKAVLAGALIGIGVALKLYPLLLIGPAAGALPADRADAGVHAHDGGRGPRAGWWSTLPVLVLFPRGWSEFFPAQHPPR